MTTGRPEDGTNPLAVVLYERNPPDQRPSYAHLKNLVPERWLRRITSGEIVVEPGNFAALEGGPRNGSLGVLPGGGFAVFVIQNRQPLAVILGSGLHLESTPGVSWVSDWRLLWREDDQERELCSFSVQSERSN